MYLLQMSVSASLIIAAAIIIRAVALGKFPKQVFQLFWLAACLRLLVPFSFPSGLSVYNLLKQTEAPVTAGSAITTQAFPLDETGGIVMQPAAAVNTISPLAVIWLAGCVALAAYLIVVNLMGKRSFGESLPLRNDYTSWWLAQNRIRRTVSVRTSDRVTTPLTYGIVNPVILLPATMDFADREQLTYILTHEMLHIRRFDLVKRIVLMAVLCIHWFNPMVWAMYVLANRDIELACDEGVLRALGADSNSGYALALIAMQEKKSRHSLVNCFSRYAIKERITSIMKYKKTSIMALVVAIVLVAGVTTAFASTGRLPADKNPDIEISTATGTMMSHTDEKTNETLISDDSGKTWMTKAEHDAKNPAAVVEWWTAEEYEKWLQQEKESLQDIIGSKGWNPTDGWYIWTQEKVDETIAMYEQTLQEIKGGIKYSKTVDGNDMIAMAQNSSLAQVSSSYCMVITNPDGSKKEFNDYANRNALARDVQAYLGEQVENGKMTQTEAEKVMDDLATSASFTEIVVTNSDSVSQTNDDSKTTVETATASASAAN